MQHEGGAGRIFTFYSFKGGVGRTMALANVAYLAAQHDLRVLMMDWDLEAPGLSYYFRGLVDTGAALEVKNAPGVMDFLWEWRNGVSKARSSEDISNLSSRFRSGAPFEACVRHIVDPTFIPGDGVLHFIGAGRRQVGDVEPMPYEDALARFSWHSFFEEAGGGFVVDSLRAWAKGRYDLILVDSRTGLADAAGLCTMQLPDEVVLCFVLNRQNIDGVAKVAAAIRAKRAEQVKLRVAPMRVARQETPEESDARARAKSELTRIGGFSLDSVHDDLRVLSVAVAENVPFYETLSLFSAVAPSLDVLTLNYLRLAGELLGRQLSVPVLDPDLVELVRARLQPRHATAEYLAKLTGAEPNRRLSELERLVASAREAQSDGGQLDAEYIEALVEAAFSFDDPELFFEAFTLQGQALDLLRTLTQSDPDRWKGTLVASLERHLSGPMLDDEEEVAELDEIDALLAESPTLASTLRRIAYRRRAAWIFFAQENLDVASQTIGEVNALAKELRRDAGADLSPEQSDDLLASEVDVLLLRGDIHASKDQREAALNEFLAALARVTELDASSARADLRKLRAEAHLRLALTPVALSKEIPVARHAVEAARWGSGAGIAVRRFTELAKVILASENSAEDSLAFIEIVFGPAERSSQVGHYFGRTARMGEEFLSVLVRLVQATALRREERTVELLRRLVGVAERVLMALIRRRSVLGGRSTQTLVALAHELKASLHNAGVEWSFDEDLSRALASLGQRSMRAGRGHDLGR